MDGFCKSKCKIYLYLKKEKSIGRNKMTEHHDRCLNINSRLRTEPKTTGFLIRVKNRSIELALTTSLM